MADHAKHLGISESAVHRRSSTDHMGAALADAVLQSGLNYRTVVMRRVARIQSSYPGAAVLSGVTAIVEQQQVAEFLDWKHPTKIKRFVDVVDLLVAHDVECVGDLRRCLASSCARDRLLTLCGVGPKTYDYLCCLVGIDRIAVDRHVKTFANDAGVLIGGYEELQLAVSYAADLLGLPRRDFDAWIWQHWSQRSAPLDQYAVL